MSIKISVIMASFLGDYDFAATDRIRKFHRAIDSFKNQTHKNAELIVVSDGCTITATEILKHKQHNIKLLVTEKQPLFSGHIRHIGNYVASGDIICYLDTDDFIGKTHLERIESQFSYYKNLDWIYFDDHIIYRFNPTNNEILSTAKRDVKLEQGSIGTSSIAHKKDIGVSWDGCDGYNHDWEFIKRLINLNKSNLKVEGCEYYVCHIPNSVDN